MVITNGITITITRNHNYSGITGGPRMAPGLGPDPSGPAGATDHNGMGQKHVQNYRTMPLNVT